MAGFWQQIRRLIMLSTLLAASTDMAFAADHGVILMYHHVASDTPYDTSISPLMFRAHMTYLKDNGFNVMALDELVGELRAQRQLPEKSVAITFDDGYASVYTQAYPVLKSMEFPFTIFISTLPIDQELVGYTSWAQLREMSDNGVLIGNHSLDHLYMLERQPGESETQWLLRLRTGIMSAEAQIEMQTNQANRILAYPYGEYDEDIKNLLAELDFTGFGQNSGAVGWHSDFLALPRFPLGGAYTSLETASLKFSTRAFHISEQIPASAVTTNTSPALQLRIEPGNYDSNRLNCFAANQPANIVWLDQPAGLLTMNPVGEFLSRRWLYTCTAPALDSNDYYWFSKPWVNPSRARAGY